MESLSWLVSSAFVFGIFSMSAAAQSAFLTVGDWSMVPIVNTTTNQVTGIFAVKHATRSPVTISLSSPTGSHRPAHGPRRLGSTAPPPPSHGSTPKAKPRRSIRSTMRPNRSPSPRKPPSRLSLASSKVIRSKKSSPTPSSDRPYSRCLSPRDIRPPTTRYPESTTKTNRVMSTPAMTMRF